MQIPAILVQARNTLQPIVTRSASNLWGVVKPRPCMTVFLGYNAYKITRCSLQTSDEEGYTPRDNRSNYDVNKVTLFGFVLAAAFDHAIAPSLISQVVEHPVSTACFAYTGWRILDTGTDGKEKLGYDALAALLAGVTLRLAGPKLSTLHPWLTWVRW